MQWEASHNYKRESAITLPYY